MATKARTARYMTNRESDNLSPQPTDRLKRDMLKSRLRDLLHDCAASAPVEQADRIREAYDLLLRSASHSDGSSGSVPDKGALDATLTLGAYEGAVIALVGGGESFMLSQGAHGICIASVVLPGGSDEVVSEGSTMALALLCAHITSIIPSTTAPTWMRKSRNCSCRSTTC